MITSAFVRLDEIELPSCPRCGQPHTIMLQSSASDDAGWQGEVWGLTCDQSSVQVSVSHAELVSAKAPPGEHIRALIRRAMMGTE